MPSKTDTNEKPDPRPFWSGTLTFGLVSVPIELFPAIRSHRVPLRMIGPGGLPLKRRYYCTSDGELLTSDEIVRGYERDDGQFVVVTDDELDALEPRKSREIDLRRFVDRDRIPLGLLERPYLLAPAGESTKAYHLLAETMERTNRAGIATFVMRGKEYLTAIIAEDGLLRASTLRFMDELRTPEDIGLPEVEPASRQARRTAEAELKKLSQKKLDRDLLLDRQSEALLALAEKKRAEAKDVVEVPEEIEKDETHPTEVVDIMSVLKRRLENGDNSKRAPSGPESADDLVSLSKKELYEQAAALDVPGRSAMTKDELIAAIRTAA